MEDPLDDPLFEMPPAGPPAVHLASGPGPSPALDPDPRLYTTSDALAHLDGLLLAQMTQYDPDQGRRGWKVYVCTPDGADNWPKRDISRPATRPPLIAARVAALAALGYEPANGPQTNWEWNESTTLDYRAVSLYASVPVRAVRPLDEGACPGCRGRGARVLPTSSTETECSECEGTGRIPDDERVGVQHRAAVAGLTCIPVAGSSMPTPAYGAPALPVLPPQYVDSGAHTREERI